MSMDKFHHHELMGTVAPWKGVKEGSIFSKESSLKLPLTSYLIRHKGHKTFLDRLCCTRERERERGGGQRDEAGEVFELHRPWFSSVFLSWVKLIACACVGRAPLGLDHHWTAGPRPSAHHNTLRQLLSANLAASRIRCQASSNGLV